MNLPVPFRQGFTRIGALQNSAVSDLGQILCVVIPKITGGLGQLLLSLLLVRFLGIEQFGAVSICLTGVLLLDAVAGSAIDMAIFRLAPLYRAGAPGYARAIEKAGLLIKPLGAVILALPLLLFSPHISTLLFQDRNRSWLLLLSALALLGLLLFRSMQVHFQIEGRFAAYGTTDLLHTATRFGLIATVLVANLATPERLMAIYAAAGITAATIGLLWFARPVLRAAWSPTIQAAKELAGVLKWYLPTVVAGSVASRMDVFFVSAFANVREAGIYGAAQMFALVPHLLGTYLAAVFSPRVLPMWRDGRLPRVFLRYQILLCAAAVLIYALCLIAVGPLSGALLPESYRRSSEVILILLPTGLAALVMFPWTIPFILYTRPGTMFAADCIAIPATAIAFALVIPKSGAAGAAAVSSIFAGLRLLFYQGLAWSVLRGDPAGVHWRATVGAGNSLHLARSAS